MILFPQTMLQIVAAGGGLIIHLGKQTLLPQTMLQIAAAASQSGAQVTFKLGNHILLPQTMLQIAAAGRGQIIFDLN